VEVQAEAVRIQSTEAQLGRTVTVKDIDTLPVLGRAPINLITFSPGVQMSNPVDVTFSNVNGQRQGASNATLDGIDVNDAVVPRLGLSMTANNTDSVGEVHIVTSGAKAEYGRNAGGQVELITRTGTNTFHGNLFDYLRNTDLNANDFFNNLSYSAAQPLGVPRPILIQNNFGGSFGGKIKRDKLFFFFNIQDIETHATISRERTVLTDSAKAGIFQWQTTPTSPISSFNIPTNDPRKLGIDPTVKGLLALTPSPNAFDTGALLNTAGFRFNNPNNSYSRQITSKFDYNLTSTNHVFFRYSRQTNSAIDSLNSADAPFPGGVQGSQGGERWGLVGGDDWTLSPHMVNEFRYGYQSASADFVRPERLSGPQ